MHLHRGGVGVALDVDDDGARVGAELVEALVHGDVVPGSVFATSRQRIKGEWKQPEEEEEEE